MLHDYNKIRTEGGLKVHSDIKTILKYTKTNVSATRINSYL